MFSPFLDFFRNDTVIELSQSDIRVFNSYFKNYYFSDYVDTLRQDLFYILYKYKKPRILNTEEVKKPHLKEIRKKLIKITKNIDVDEIRKRTILNSYLSSFFVRKFLENIDQNTKPKEMKEIFQNLLKELDEEKEKLEKYEEIFHQILTGTTGGTQNSSLRYLDGKGIINLIENEKILRILQVFEKNFGDTLYSKNNIEHNEFNDISYGRDNVIPSEFCIDFLFDYKLLNDKLLRLKKTEQAETTDIVLIVDESGSMNEKEKEIYAKAMFLKLLQVAIKNRRNLYYIGFSDEAALRFKCESGKYDFDELRDLLVSMDNGGTNFFNAFKLLFRLIYEKEIKIGNSTEFIFLTDGEDCSESSNANFNVNEYENLINKFNLVLLDNTYKKLRNNNHWILKFSKQIFNNFLSIYQHIKSNF